MALGIHANVGSEYQVSKATRLRSRRPVNRGSSGWHRQIFFSSAQRPDWLWAPHSLLSDVHRGLTSSVKRPGRVTKHFSPPSVDVKNKRSYTSTASHIFKAWCLTKHRDSSTVTLLTTLSVGSSTQRRINFRWFWRKWSWSTVRYYTDIEVKDLRM
jgi:hypothetical protein